MESTKEIEISDKEIQEIYELDDFIKAEYLISMLCDKYFLSPYERRNYEKKLFIDYLKAAHMRNKENHLFENVLLATTPLMGELVEFLLLQNLDMDYLGYDLYGVSVRLIDHLAVNITDQNIMRLFLKKIKGSNNIYFSNSQYDTNTDLCRMNIIAGFLNESYEVFEREDFDIFCGDEGDKLIIDIYKIGIDTIVIEDFNIYKDDRLSQILYTLKGRTNVSYEEIKDFIRRIFSSEKTRLFNAYNLSLLKCILKEEDYKELLLLLENKINSGQAALFRIESSKNTIYHETLEAALKKDCAKTFTSSSHNNED